MKEITNIVHADSGVSSIYIQLNSAGREGKITAIALNYVRCPFHPTAGTIAMRFFRSIRRVVGQPGGLTLSQPAMPNKPDTKCRALVQFAVELARLPPRRMMG